MREVNISDMQHGRRYYLVNWAIRFSPQRGGFYINSRYTVTDENIGTACVAVWQENGRHYFDINDYAIEAQKAITINRKGNLPPYMGVIDDSAWCDLEITALSNGSEVDLSHFMQTLRLESEAGK